jgi:hypothetical protein
VKRECMPREEVPIQGMCEEEFVLAGAVIEVGVVDFGGE